MSVTISGPNAAGAQTAISGIIVSNTTYTSGTVSFSNANGISFGSSAGQAITASHALNVSAPGGTSNALSAITFSNSNGVSFGLSTGAGVGTLTASVQTQASLFALGNTTQNSSSAMALNALSFNGLGEVTVGFSNGSIQVSAPGQSLGVSTGGNTSGNTGTYSGQAIFAGVNNITLSVSSAAGGAQTITISGANAPAAQTGISGMQVSNTTYTSGTVTFQNANGISFGSSGANGISASYTVPAQVSLFALGNTTQNSSTVLSFSALSFNGLGEASVGFSNGSIQVSAPAQSIGVSNIGNTSGNTGTQAGQIVLAGGNNITLSVSTAAGGAQTITLQGGLNVSADVASTALSGLTFQDSNGITFGLSTGASAGTLTASYNSTQFAGTGVSTGSSASAGFGYTLSTNGLSVVNPALTRYVWPPAFEFGAIGALGNATLSIQYISIPVQLVFSRLDVLVAMSCGSAATSNTAAIALSAYGAIYTKNANSVSLQFIMSSSTQTTYSYASNTAGQTQLTASAIRNISIPFGATRIHPGEYYVGINIITATSSVGANTTNLGATMSMWGGTNLGTAVPYADIASNTATSTNAVGGMGVYSAAITGTSSPFHLSQINQTGTAQAAANIALIFRNA